MPYFHDSADGRIVQIAYTVPDLGVAMRDFSANFGAGPWFVHRRLAGPNPRYRGGPALAVNDVALGYSGETQIELIQPLDDKPSVYRETIGMRGHGFHHFGVAAPRFEDQRAAQIAKGYVLAFEDEVVGVGRVAYFDTLGVLPGMLELIEQTPALTAFFGMMQDTARCWDGSNPIREMAARTMS